jgi:hypothetical protein
MTHVQRTVRRCAIASGKGGSRLARTAQPVALASAPRYLLGLFGSLILEG